MAGSGTDSTERLQHWRNLRFAPECIPHRGQSRGEFPHIQCAHPAHEKTRDRRLPACRSHASEHRLPASTGDASGRSPIQSNIADMPRAQAVSPRGKPSTARTWFSNWLVCAAFDRPVTGIVHAWSHLVAEQLTVLDRTAQARTLRRRSSRSARVRASSAAAAAGSCSISGAGARLIDSTPSTCQCCGSAARCGNHRRDRARRSPTARVRKARTPPVIRPVRPVGPSARLVVPPGWPGTSRGPAPAPGRAGRRRAPGPKPAKGGGGGISAAVPRMPAASLRACPGHS